MAEFTSMCVNQWWKKNEKRLNYKKANFYFFFKFFNNILLPEDEATKFVYSFLMCRGRHMYCCLALRGLFFKVSQ